MKQLISFLILALVAIAGISQNVRKDGNGNYVQVKKVDTASARQTGKTFTDLKGKKYPVWQSTRGKLFVIRESRDGRKYKYYINDKP